MSVQKLDEIKDAFANRRSRLLNGTNNKEAVVVLPLMERDGEWHVLFEKRSNMMRLQPGDICFPGGSIDIGESLIEAAKREVCEELLVKENQIEILSEIDGTIGPNNIPMWAFVAVIHDYKETFSKDEVEEVFTIPLEILQNIEPVLGYGTQKFELDQGFPKNLIPGYNFSRGVKKTFYFYQWNDYVIWGATARILSAFLENIKSTCDLS